MDGQHAAEIIVVAIIWSLHSSALLATDKPSSTNGRDLHYYIIHGYPTVQLLYQKIFRIIPSSCPSSRLLLEWASPPKQTALS